MNNRDNSDHNRTFPEESIFNQNGFGGSHASNIPLLKDYMPHPTNCDEVFDLRQIRSDKSDTLFDNKSIRTEGSIYRLEHLRAHYNIPERKLVRDFHLMVSDSVNNWYLVIIEKQLE